MHGSAEGDKLALLLGHFLKLLTSPNQTSLCGEKKPIRLAPHQTELVSICFGNQYVGYCCTQTAHTALCFIWKWCILFSMSFGFFQLKVRCMLFYATTQAWQYEQFILEMLFDIKVCKHWGYLLRFCITTWSRQASKIFFTETASCCVFTDHLQPAAIINFVTNFWHGLWIYTTVIRSFGKAVQTVAQKCDRKAWHVYDT